MPKPNMSPPTTVAMPSGRMCASFGRNPDDGFGMIVAMIMEKPSVAAPSPTMMPRMVRPWPIRNRSRKAEVKQSRLRWTTNPNASPTAQNAGSAPPAAAATR